MPVNYSGEPGNITFESPLTITGASNTSPITITVSGSLPAEFYTSGGLGGSPGAPLVRIADVEGNTAANGIWTATPTGASTFTIPTSGIAPYTTGGTVQPIYVKSLYTVPSDGDADNQASISGWAAATGDRTQYLAAQIGQFKLARREIFYYQSLSSAGQWCLLAGAGVVANTAIQFVAQGVTWHSFGTILLHPTGGNPPVFALGGVVGGDFIDVRLDTTFVADGTAGGRLVLDAALAVPGVVPTWPTDYAQLTGGSVYNADSGSGGAQGTSISLHGFLGGASLAGNLYLQPVYYPFNTGTQSPACRGDTLLTVDLWRPTGMPQ